MLIWLVALLWGIGQNFPLQQLYIYGIGPGDVLFLGVFALYFAHPQGRAELIAEAARLRYFLLAILLLITLTVISSAYNALSWGIQIRDVIEALRPLYYFSFVIFMSAQIRRHGTSVIVAYLAGILVVGLAAYLNPNAADMGDFIVLWNPNVVGNVLAIGTFLVSLLVLERRFTAAALFLPLFTVLSVFSFSKGTWLMTALGIGACGIALFAGVDAQSRRLRKLLVIAAPVLLAAVVIPFYDRLLELVEFKIAATQIGDSAADGSSLAARWGFVRASVWLALEYPVFGVGISNYEHAYDTLRHALGNDYWPTDNPHSAWLYIMACIGFPALFIFAGIVLGIVIAFSRKIPINPWPRHAYTVVLASLLLLSGAVQLQLLTQHYLWFLASIAFGWRLREPRATMAAEAHDLGLEASRP